ncbi:hypothetical protein [Streptacidiphilus cavernicola]|uniref:hypothetical protein n=1 Tax=Streptacidiphilus cavernicola TaxID=3342716 RepID=UPI0036D3486A
MTMTNQESGSAATVAYTRAQLDARACIQCGSADGELVPAGHVQYEIRPGEPLGWAVVAHPEHLPVAS